VFYHFNRDRALHETCGVVYLIYNCLIMFEHMNDVSVNCDIMLIILMKLILLDDEYVYA